MVVPRWPTDPLADALALPHFVEGSAIVFGAEPAERQQTTAGRVRLVHLYSLSRATKSERG